MSYEVHVKQVAPELVVTRRAHTTLADIPTTMHATLTQIAEHVEPAGAARGAPFAIYHNEPFRPDDVDVEIGVPLAPNANVAPGGGDAHRLAGGPVAYTTHTGSYASIGAAYAALYGWLERHGHRPCGPPREIYLVGPGQTPSAADYRTEIDVPLA